MTAAQDKTKAPVQKVKSVTVVYIILYVVIPAIVLLASLGMEDYPVQKGLFASAAVRIFFIFTLPIYLVYAVIINKAISETKNRWLFLVFIPHIANILWYAYSYRFSTDWLRIMIFDSIPMFLALSLFFTVGLFFIMTFMAIDSIGTADQKGLLGRVLVTLFILGTYSIPVYYFFMVGWYMALGYNPNNEIMGIFKYLFSIALIIFSHFGIIRSLYLQGKF